MIASLLLLTALAGAPEMKVLHSSRDIAGALGHTVRLTGTAQDAKLAAAVVTGDLLVYCLGRSSWNDRAGKQVSVEGKLERTAAFEARVDDGGAVSQGTGGPVLVIRSCTVK